MPERSIESLAPLTPIQHGLLFHSLSAEGSGVYVEQLDLALRPRRAPLDAAALAAAWEIVFARHEVLRTAFIWERKDEPLQLVVRTAELPLRVEDRTGVPPPEQDARHRAFLAEDRALGFDLSTPPLFRIAVFVLAPDLWRVVCTYHHVLLDAWSIRLLLGEWLRVYDDRLAGRASSPLPAPVPYRQHVEWLLSRDGSATEPTWREMLAGFTTPTPLPFEGRGAAEGRPSHGHASLRWSPEETRAVAAFARRERLTMSTLVHAAWGLVLARTGGSDDVVFGVTVAGRPPELSGADRLIGLCINTLPIRLRVRDDQDGISWLRGVQQQLVRLNRLHASALADVQRWSAVPSGIPLFQSVVVYENAPVADLRSEAIEVTSARYRFQTHYPLTLLAQPGDALELRLGYDTTRFEASAAARLLGYVGTLLLSLSETGPRPLGRAQMVPREEERTLRAWSEGEPEARPFVALPVRVRRWAEPAPTRIAVLGEDGSGGLTYGALEARVGAVVRRLQAQGVGAGHRVAMLLRRSPRMIEALLGILRSGAAYVPLDPANPPERIRCVLAEAAVSAVLTEGALLPLAAGGTAKVLRLDEGCPKDDGMRGKGAAEVPVGELDSAYVIYTSGSTGKPKGVVIDHGALANLLVAMADLVGATAEDRWLAVTTTAFDIAAVEIFVPLITGGSVVVAGEETARDAGALARCIDDAGVTVMQATPATLQMLLDGGWTPRSRLRVLVGGDTCPRSLADRLLGAGLRVWNMYGPTEATIWATAHPVSAAAGPLPIGRPLPGVRCYVCDGGGRLQALGVAGELHLGHRALAHGYWQRHDLTADRFVPSPFAAGERLYRTGDLVRYREDGALELLGRLDDQVKVRGFRVELGEVETALLRHPHVHSAVVVLNRAGSSGDSLIGHFVAEPGESVPIDELRAFLAQTLPPYMVPGLFVLHETLPLTPNGKVDRQRLAAISAPSSASVERAAPRTATEEQVVEVWKELLGLASVGVHERFLEVGGHSLLMTQLAHRIHRAFKANLSLRALYTASTPAAQAALVDAEQHRSASGEGDPVRRITSAVPHPEHRYHPFPLNDLQQAYWVGRRFGHGDSGTHLYVEFESSDLDPVRCERAWRRLVERHDMLRVVISEDGMQEVLTEAPPFEVPCEDLRERVDAAVAEALERTRTVAAHRVFQPEHWPLFDLRLTRIADGRHRVHLAIDGLVADAWSWRVLLDELGELYRSPDAALPPTDLTFRDYVAAEEAYRESERYARDWAYWERVLADLPPAPRLPTRETPAGERRFARRSGAIEEASTRRLLARAAAAGVTPSAVLLAAFAAVVARWSRDARFTLSVPQLGRLPVHPDVERLVGPFASFLLVEMDCRVSEPFDTAARRVHEALTDHIDHGTVSGVRMLRELGRQHGNGAPPAMPVVFTSLLGQSGHGRDRSLAEHVSPLGTVVCWMTATSQVLLDCTLSERGGRLRIDWDYLAEAFPPGLIEDMLAAYTELVYELGREDTRWDRVIAPELPARQVALRTGANSTDAPVPSGLLHELVARSVEARPAARALAWRDGEFSYADLWRRVLGVAALLRATDPRPDEIVGVVMERGWEQVVAALGVLVAGAIYLPLDAGLPPERLHYVLRDADVRTVLTQRTAAARLVLPRTVRCLPIDALGAHAGAVAAAERAATDLAVVIYTSGSTGTPKGVMLEHQGLVNTIVHTNQAFGVGPRDRVLSVTPFFHDMALFDVFGVLSAGGTVVLPEPGEHRDPSLVVEAVEQHRVTLWSSVPSLLEMVLDHAEQAGCVLESLRLAFVGGDWIPLDAPARLKRIAPRADLVSVGGPTETSIWNIAYRAATVEAGWTSIPYGRPLANTKYFVLNERMEDCPEWVPGSLYCSGFGLARGYLGDEVKTRAQFIQHPASGTRLFRSGDLGRYRPSGDIEILGREDSQVKIRGYRVELREVELALAGVPGVCQAMVVAPEVEPRQRRLVAFVVTGPERGAEIGELRAALAARLPEYMVPSTIERVETLPTSRNGKIDRAALLAMAASLPRAGRVEAIPSHLSSPMASGSTVARVSKIVAQVLRSNHIPPDADLLELGASSVDIARVANRLERELGARPRLDVVYRNPTLMAIAAACERNVRPVTAIELEMPVANGDRLIDPAEREEFKRRQPGLRADRLTCRGRRAVVWAPWEGPPPRLAAFEDRQSVRQFDRNPVPSDHLGRLLDILRQRKVQGQPKYLYPSPGGLYATQTYLHVQEGRVGGVAAGTYYYDPVDHALTLLVPGVELASSIHIPFVNRPIFESAAFSLFFISQMAAIAPMYGDLARHFVTLEAGYMGQLLMMAAPEAGLGLCPIGSLDFDRVAYGFALDPSHWLVHSMLGGVPQQDARAAWSRVTESRPERCGHGDRPGRVRRDEPLRLSLGQERLWVLSRMKPASADARPVAVWLRGPLDAATLRESIADVILRHDALRARVVTVKGRAHQVIDADAPPFWAEIHLTDGPAEARRAEALRLAAVEAGRPFQLALGPLLRVTLIHVSRDEALLVLVAHLFAVDGWSLGILFREVSELYAARSERRPATLADITLQYPDYAAWQRQWLASSSAAASLEYWTETLAGARPELSVPPDFPRPTGLSFPAGTWPVELPPALTARLDGFCQRGGITAFTALLVALQCVLARFGGRSEATVASAVSERGTVDLEDVIGPFGNLILLRLDLAGAAQVRDLLARAQATVAGACEHQRIPFEAISDHFTRTNHRPLTPATLLVLHNDPRTGFELPGVSVEVVPLAATETTVEIDMSLTRRDGALAGTLTYNASLYEERTVAKLATAWRRVLEGLLDMPDRPPAQLLSHCGPDSGRTGPGASPCP